MDERYEPKDNAPIPPKDAKVVTTACDYCIVGCGYKAYVWPQGRQGGTRASENAFGVDYPAPAFSGRWTSPNQHNVVTLDGKPQHVVIVPDPDAVVVNRGGNHSIRGGAIAKKCFNPDTPMRDRLQTPLLRVNGELVPVSWDLALDVMADVSKHVLDRHGKLAWGMKTYSYEFFENTYAISKLAFASVKTPAYAPHDKPGPGADAAGLDDAGIDSFSASYEDWAESEVIYVSGTDPFETKTVLFTEWILKGRPKRLIMALPRKSAGVAWAEKNGGLFLPVYPGSDTLLHLAISRIILENGWEDAPWIAQHVANSWEIGSGFGRGSRDTPWQWRTTWDKLGTDFEGYKDWLLAYAPAQLEHAAKVTGVSAAKIVAAAEMLAKPEQDGYRRKASFGLEKGCYWSNNYLNTASFASMALLCGAGNRPGQVISRFGGHQRGWLSGGDYPRVESPEKFPGRRRKELDLDRWVEAGNLRMAWVIGTTWTGAMAASQELAQRFREMTRESPHQIGRAERGHAVEVLKQRVDERGMFVVVQDIYLQQPIGTEVADLVLPASGWGEHDFSRCNGERRLRLYGKIYDPPGEAKPDWWIIAAFARRMGFEGYDWKDSNDVFEEAARFSRGGALDYFPLVWRARRDGRKGHALLRELGTTGIQTPIRLVDGELVGTKRLHDSSLELGPPEGPTVHSKWLTAFNTHSGKALLHKSPWEMFSDFYERAQPRGEELWVTNGRINEIWQSAYDDVRRPYIVQRWPETFFEIHPKDAQKRGIESGDYVEIVNDDVLIQTGGFLGVEGDDLSYTALEKAGKIRVGSGSCRGVAFVTEGIREGVVFANFLDPASPSNSLVHRVPDPLTNRYRFKLGKGVVRRTGESPYKRDLSQMTFVPRTIA